MLDSGAQKWRLNLATEVGVEWIVPGLPCATALVGLVAVVVVVSAVVGDGVDEPLLPLAALLFHEREDGVPDLSHPLDGVDVASVVGGEAGDVAVDVHRGCVEKEQRGGPRLLRLSKCRLSLL